MMTREEQIKEAAYNNNRESSQENQSYFVDGAKWADEHPQRGLVDIDLIADWLIRNQLTFMINENQGFNMDCCVYHMKKAFDMYWALHQDDQIKSTIKII